MKKLLVAFACTVALMGAVAQPKSTPKIVYYDAKITRIIDGDTVAFEAKWLPPPLKSELSLRVYGVDTPEKSPRAKCDIEAAKSKAATTFTTNAIVNAKVVRIGMMEWDKYGGRVLGDVLVDGKSLRFLLISNGLAREYYGNEKMSWCK